MAELAFHRKYRPNTLKGYIGNDKLKASMLSALKRDKRPQVILLSGDSGCGKTTFARLLAKEYLCEDRDNEMGACNTCYSCEQLDDYIQTGDTSMLENVREVDIADQSGKKDIDTVLEDMMIPSFGGQWRVFIFDEVHMATNQAQNRMLKIAEEPPENVLMIFCTTDPDMLLETLRNRCQLTLKVRKPSVAELGGLLKRVCTTEGVDCDTKGVNFIANRSGLTIRKALTSLEQVVNECGNANYESAIGVFEELADTTIIDFLEKLIGKPQYDSSGVLKTDEFGNPIMKRDTTAYISTLHKVKTQTSLQSFVQYLLDFVQRGIYVINQIQLDGVADGELVVYRNLFGTFSIEMITGLVGSLVSLLDAGTDLELRLLHLGYTGIPMGTYNRLIPKKEDVVDSELAFVLDEISKEVKSGDTERSRMKQEIEEKGVSNAVDLTRASSLSDVEALFGGTEVPL